MKKTFGCILILVILIPVCALGAGKLTTTNENFYVVKSWSSLYGYVFMRLENTGNKPIEYSAGLFEVYDENGDTLASDSYIRVYGQYIAPGEYAYASVYEELKDVEENQVDDFMTTMTGKSTNGETMKFECETQYLPDYRTSRWSTADVMKATFINNTDDIVYGITTVFALLDDADNILYVDTVSTYNSVGLMPGSGLTMQCNVSDNVKEAYEKQGLKPTHVDAFAYVYVEED